MKNIECTTSIWSAAARRRFLRGKQRRPPVAYIAITDWDNALSAVFGAIRAEFVSATVKRRQAAALQM